MNRYRWIVALIRGEESRQPRRRRLYFRRGPARDPRYRAFIRSFPCLACGICGRSEAAHTGPHGIGQKASDYRCLPLCREHHRASNYALDVIGAKAFEEYWQVSISQAISDLNEEWKSRRDRAA